MFNKFLVIFASCGLVIFFSGCLLYLYLSEKAPSLSGKGPSTSVRASGNVNIIKVEENISEFNGWASLSSKDFSYNKLKEGIPENADYIILATVATHPVSFEAILTYQNDVLNFSFWSSDFNEVIRCESSVAELNVDVVDNKKFPAKAEFGYDIHPFYTIVEKRKDNIVTVSTYDFFSDSLWEEFNKLRDHLLSKTPENCNPFNPKE